MRLAETVQPTEQEEDMDYIRKPPQLGSKTGQSPKNMQEALKAISDLQEDMRNLYRHLYGVSVRTDPLLERLEDDYNKRRQPN